MPAKFVLQNNSLGDYYFNLHTDDGDIIASSEVYESKDAALKGIELVQTNAATASVEDETT